ncbi:MAG: hypothetical protein JSW52_09060 [Candidatus Coatesbacteria bacterium]|nr:MAG: hypothetical protein JSW52_09060 [Candidatus Coatesbacteria bacterium]
MKITVVDYVKVIWKYKWLIAFCFLFAAVLGFGVSLLMEPEYSSSVVIVLQEETAKKGLSTDFLAGGILGLETKTGTEIAIIESDACLGKVVNDLQLFIDRSDIPRDETGHQIIGDIYLNETIAYDTYKVEFVDGAGNYRVSTEGGRYVGSGSCGDWFRGGGMGFLLSPIETPRKGTDFEIKVDDPVAYVPFYATKKMKISIESDDILIIQCHYDDAVKTKQIAERIVAEYLYQKQEYGRSVSKEISQLIKRRMNYILRERNKAENELMRHQQEEGVIFTEDMVPIIEPISALKNEATLAEVQRETLRLYMRELEGKGDTDVSYIDSMTMAGVITGDSSLIDLQRNIYEAETTLTGLRSTYTNKHPMVTEQEEKVRLLKSELLNRTHDSLREAIAGVNKRVTLLEDKYNVYYQDLPPKQMEAARLSREIYEADTIYNTLAAEYEQHKVEEAKEDSKKRYIRVITEPTIPKRPDKPRKKMNALVSGVFGGFFGVVFAFILHMFDFTPVLSKIPGYDKIKSILDLRKGIFKRWKTRA